MVLSEMHLHIFSVSLWVSSMYLASFHKCHLGKLRGCCCCLSCLLTCRECSRTFTLSSPVAFQGRIRGNLIMKGGWMTGCMGKEEVVSLGLFLLFQLNQFDSVGTIL